VEHLAVLGAGSDLLVESGIPAPPAPVEGGASFRDSLAASGVEAGA
jgi:hypothetical protein